MRKVVLIHGFWYGSWAWSLVTEQLAGRGITSVAVDMDGHGAKNRFPKSRWAEPFDPAAFAAEPSPVSDITATTAAETLVKQIETIGGGEACVVVAHSGGGVIATRAAELAPSLFAHLVYVTAFAPVSGRPASAYTFLPECEGSGTAGLNVGDPMATGALRIDTDHNQAAIRQTFLGDVDDLTAAAAVSLFGTDVPLGIAGEPFEVTSARYGAIPHTYVTCANDNAIPITLQRLFIKEIDDVSGAPANVVDFDCAHSPFLTRPTALADVIAGVC
jgi:pimeloyl-ACP methyl ester carboxylesterase